MPKMASEEMSLDQMTLTKEELSMHHASLRYA
jgi:hypothetical protein